MRVSKEMFCKCAKDISDAMKFLDETIDKNEYRMEVNGKLLASNQGNFLQAYMNIGSVAVENLYELSTNHYNKPWISYIMIAHYNFCIFDCACMHDYIGLDDDIPPFLKTKLLQCATHDDFYDLLCSTEKTYETIGCK